MAEKKKETSEVVDEKNAAVTAEPANEVVDKPEISEDDFVDDAAAKIQAAKPVEEVKKPEEVKPEPVKEPEPPEPTSYQYDDDKLAAVDKARLAFFDSYKKSNRIKTIVSIGILVVIVAGWIVPYLIPALNGTTAGLVISLVTVGVCIAALGLFSFFFRKKSDKEIKAYFAQYYGYQYSYALDGLDVKGYHGELDNKLQDQEFKDCGMYADVYKVGSRFGVTFTYRNMDCAIVDAASQKKGKKALETTFVGKYFRAPNHYEGQGIYIYLKGNDRAIPPNGLGEYDKIEDNSTLTIYGDPKDKKFLTKNIRNAIGHLKTDKTLVDVAIAIRPGRTYIALGYEDNLMVIPLQKAFNPAPVTEFKKNLKAVLDLASLLNE